MMHLILIQKIYQMSDYDYDEQYQYDEPADQMEQQNIETTLEFDNYQAEQLLRQKKFEEALQAFQQIYNKADLHNVRSWKAKVLTQLLQIHVMVNNDDETRNTLHKIRQMNDVDKISEQQIKTIIKTLSSVKREVYESFWDDIFSLIVSLDDKNSRLKCYFLMFQKEIQSKNIQKSKQLYEIINKLSSEILEIVPSLELQLAYLEILYLKLHNQQYHDKLANIYIKLPRYQQDTNVNENYLSRIKQQIAVTLYEDANYAECCNFLCGSFRQNSKYGSNAQKNKLLLKINTLMIFLCGKQELLQDAEFNPMLQQSTSAFKADPDIQAMYGLISAFKAQQIGQFQEVLKQIKLNLPANSPYSTLQKKVLLQLKKQKIVSICRSYRTIKFDYLARRIMENDFKKIQQIIFSLLTGNKLKGIIHLHDQYLEILPPQNKYYTLQLENLHDLTKRI